MFGEKSPKKAQNYAALIFHNSVFLQVCVAHPYAFVLEISMLRSQVEIINIRIGLFSITCLNLGSL